jgi:hypothetical protein
MHTAQLLTLEPRSFEIEIATEKLKRYKLPGADQIQVELIHTQIHKLINSISKKEEMP